MAETLEESRAKWLRLIAFKKAEDLEIKEHMEKQFAEIRKLVRSWYKVKAPKNQDVSLKEMQAWLETNVTKRYYWDTMNVVNDPRDIWLESYDDLIFFNLTWDVYDT